MALGFDPEGFWTITPRELSMRMKAADLRQRREHNDRMVSAFWASNWSHMKNPPKLRSMLVDVDARPAAKKDWRTLKAALQVALAA